MSEKTKQRRAIKKGIRGFGWILNAQHLLLLLVVVAYGIGAAIAAYRVNGSHVNFNQLVNRVSQNGLPMILAVIFAFIPILCFRRKRFFTYDITARNKKMTVKVFLVSLFLVLGVNTVLGLLSYPTDALLHAIGFTAKPSEQVLDGSTTLSMLVYTCLIAPVLEEFLYRGFILRSLEKFGSFFAIATSALLFGLMHENIIQLPYAFGIGLIFGYLAKTYSIKLTILIHIANNTLGELFSDLVPSSGLIGTSLNLVFSILPVAVAIWVIWHYRLAIRSWFRENRPNKAAFVAFYTSLPILILIISNIINTMLGIEKL